ncbi:MAG TPA: redoxin domain-containing protein [Kaistia sp.]|nr:redoxin domain-containing protein [Kaistia sp.]
MSHLRSIAVIAVALAGAGATAIACFGETLGSVLVGSDRAAATRAGASDAYDYLAPLEAAPWIDGDGAVAPSLRGKVVVVNFWTYSCINSLRALPYLRAWIERYRDSGLVVLGVHAPEFGFEKDTGKVRQALARLNPGYPTIQDNDYAIWRRFGNEGWPGFIFIDAAGKLRGYRLGEGEYAESEQLIRHLLSENGRDVSGLPLSAAAGYGIEADADWNDLRSPETYLGYEKARGFRSPGGFVSDGGHRYAAASRLAQNTWDLAGFWTVGPEFAALGGAEGAISIRFHARDAHLVLGSDAGEQPIPFRVTLDGAAPGADHGADTDADGRGEIRDDRLYQLVRQSGAVGDRTLTITFGRPGVRAYVFTFG